MRSVIVIQSGAGASAPIPLNTNADPVNYTLQSVIAGGPPTYNIEWTLDDPFGAVAPVTWTAFTGLSALTAGAALPFSFPVRAIRINITGGSGSVTLTVVQAGGITGA